MIITMSITIHQQHAYYYCCSIIIVSATRHEEILEREYREKPHQTEEGTKLVFWHKLQTFS